MHTCKDNKKNLMNNVQCHTQGQVRFFISESSVLISYKKSKPHQLQMFDISTFHLCILFNI